MHRSTRHLTVAALGMLAAGAAAAQEPAFLAKAAQGDLAEVRMGTLAEAHGSSAKVKSYGKLLVTDHGAHRTKVAALAKAKGVAVPADLDVEQKAGFDHLAGLQRTAFDAAFKEHMIADHEKDIANYSAQTSNPDTQVATLAKETLPVLRKHLAAAQAL